MRNRADLTQCFAVDQRLLPPSLDHPSFDQNRNGRPSRKLILAKQSVSCGQQPLCVNGCNLLIPVERRECSSHHSHNRTPTIVARHSGGGAFRLISAQADGFSVPIQTVEQHRTTNVMFRKAIHVVQQTELPVIGSR